MGKMKTAERIKLAREQAGLSAGQIAKLLEYSKLPAVISKERILQIEAGEVEPTPAELETFVKSYKVGYNWLTCQDEKNQEKLSDFFDKNGSKLETLNEKDLGTVINFVQMVIG
jgi:transcriptional regulator with XRE-family HTH domain